jgi:hypothetical protein
MSPRFLRRSSLKVHHFYFAESNPAHSRPSRTTWESVRQSQGANAIIGGRNPRGRAGMDRLGCLTVGALWSGSQLDLWMLVRELIGERQPGFIKRRFERHAFAECRMFKGQ